ncbi:MAG: alpha/beta fold hydrolase [Anaerolineales bacterium]|nr:alpha/beta fold hydrolase [Anaerolineales bacterium]
MSEILSGGEPFLHPGNDVGCLLLHGFTSSPDELRELGNYLSSRGYTVLGVRLFGHATRESDMNRARYRDWIASAEDGYHMLRPNCKHIILVGLSMGGVLSLILAARWPTNGVVGMGTPHELPSDPRLPFARPLSFIWPRVPKPKSRRHADEEWPPHVTYEHYPTHAVAELNDLLAAMRSSLPKVATPVLLMHALEDSAVDPDHMHKIKSELGSDRVRSMLIEDSGHLIPVDDQRQRAFRAIDEFVKDVTGNPDR